MSLDILKIEQCIQELLTPEEFIVKISLSHSNDIDVVVDGEKGISIERCIAISKGFEKCFNRDETDYSLEVGSACLTTPFAHLRQYQKHIGNPVRVITKEGNKFDGVLKSSDDQSFSIVCSELVKSPDGRHRKRHYEEVEHTFLYEEVKSTTYRFE
ncbi:ribosome assembly cofactor RimP [Porphyromonas circumdentaria]|uniref:Ribosome maturation factor RimP n=1 Tax=Porphyromonas circumdentaria TaxID=29524 RepID=A0A1T4L8K5_9PORP|nr:ribosome assembly cofactor RimP [Porphyromonas circumdentaria]MBB6275366.1 ribosome maturation factor RimP [Porphyromonas circumdentaria]SJZ50827.1 ribosome maturation factor RimP [Porphyromonas circumdentaria]